MNWVFRIRAVPQGCVRETLSHARVFLGRTGRGHATVHQPKAGTPMAGALIRSSFVHRSVAPPVARSLQRRFNRSAPTLHRLRCRRSSGRTPITYISEPAVNIILKLVLAQILDYYIVLLHT